LVDKLEAFLRRYNELSKKLANPDTISNSESFKKFSIEFKEIEPVVLKYGELKKV
jgi:peptide chain release factor 1